MNKKNPLHENFREYTAVEINKIKIEVCLKHDCPYLSKGPSNNTKQKSYANATCDYYIATGVRRTCMPDVCTHWKDSKDSNASTITRKQRNKMRQKFKM